MRIKWVAVILFLFTCFGAGTARAQSESNLTPAQELGRRVFQQRCGVCHTKVNLASPMYGISLNKELVDGNEKMIADYIRNGSKKMPGFKYGLEPTEIDAIVAYLKTVPKQAAAPPSSAAKPDNTATE
jgi:mono/diheme cytochrome c family protein